jgi:uncharacterized Fe-S cluster-containing protein
VGSGNSQVTSEKGDVLSPSWLVEAKDTKGTSYTLKLATLRKIEAEALKRRRHPCLVVDIAGRRYVVMGFDLWALVASRLDY